MPDTTTATATRRPNFNRAFAIGIALNIAFVAIEALYGWKINSLALLADAGHNLSDVAGLVLAWGGALAGRLRPDARHTYGWQRASHSGGLPQCLAAAGGHGLAGLGSHRPAGHRPRRPKAGPSSAVAGVGIVVNTATALLFMRGRKGDLNIRGAFLHMAADALVSLGVVMGGALYLWQGWAWIDPVMSLAIAVVIVAGTWSLFRQSLHLLFDGVPEQRGPGRRCASCCWACSGVADVHDLHVWAMGTSQTALTAHLVLSDPGAGSDAVLQAGRTGAARAFRDPACHAAAGVGGLRPAVRAAR